MIIDSFSYKNETIQVVNALIAKLKKILTMERSFDYLKISLASPERIRE